MIDAGKLKITLLCDNEKVQHVDIQSTRPLHISSLFIGKTPEKTLKIIPLLFNVCGVAQSFVALKACSQALGINENATETAARNLLLNVEIIREHCWWLLISIDKAQLALFLKHSVDFKKALFLKGDSFSLDSQIEIKYEPLDLLISRLETDLDTLFLNQRQRFLEVKNEHDLTDWLTNNVSIPANLLQNLFVQNYQNLGQCSLRLLPSLTDFDLLTNLDSQTPSWQNKCHETSCLNRQQQQPLIANLLKNYGNGLVTRLASRLLELAMMPKRLRQNQLDLLTPLVLGSNRIQNTVSVAQIEASRGLLIHKVELNNGVIEDYKIIAPTEWNFQPNGVAALSLQFLSAYDKRTLRRHAELIINTIDPCVGFELVID